MARIAASKRTPGWLRAARYAVLGLVILALLFGYKIVELYTDWLWFDELHQTGVFRTTIGAGLLLFFGFGLLFFLICYFNLWLALRLNATRPLPRMTDVDQHHIGEMIQRISRGAALGGSILVAFLVGGNAATHWSDYLLFTHAGPFGTTDPVFHNDVGFYIFRLPFLNYLQGWFLFTLIVTTVATAAVHYSARAIDFIAGSLPTFTGYVRRHLLALLSLVALIYAWSLQLGRYDLLYAENGQFVGAGYTDLHVRLPAMNLQIGLMLVVAILCFVNIWQGRAFRLPLAGLGAWVVVSVIGLGLWPGVVQRLTVIPNQLAREQEYIANDLASTRQAYGVDHVKLQPFAGTAPLTTANLTSEQATINNIRLWDWPQLGLVYQTKQALYTYYGFPSFNDASTGNFNIDVDRYAIAGKEQQVMLGARELDAAGLPAQAKTWQNQRLQYTHGYGVVMSPVDRKDAEGQPEYYLSQIPVQSDVPGLTVDRPQIYYGEQNDEYVFVDTKQDEFDYAAKDGNKTTRYTGHGGVPLGGTLQRLAWSLRLGDANMLLSSDLTDRSRILFRRNITERVQRLAPFLNWDNDPYVVVDGGRLFWMMDAYTVSDHYPYSKPSSAGTDMPDVTQDFNYIRNSVKAVVDAYDGTVTLYIADPTDPIVQTWSRVFPTLFTPMTKMPAGLRAHVRYPEDLFRFQRDIYTLYHMTDPGVYYRKEDAWAVPPDPTPPTDVQGNTFAAAGPRPMMPYYVIMRLPDEKAEEFLMISPFTPLAKDNISAWMCARCDPDNYGQLIAYRFPSDRNVNGPRQIMGQIQAQNDISRLVSLLDQRGSHVIFGNLLAIPIQSSLLYAVPLYVQASAAGANPIPELSQVIVASGDRIIMRETLHDAIVALGQGDTTTAADANVTTGTTNPPPQTPNPGTTSSALPTGPATVPDLLRRAGTAYDTARRRQRDYDAALDDLGRALKDLQQKLNSPGKH